MLLIRLILVYFLLAGAGVRPQTLPRPAYLGFDRNGYPGDNNLKVLRQTFSYVGYWLNNPPGENINGWKGKRAVLGAAGFGYLVLFNGRLHRELISGNAEGLARGDATEATKAARSEGFPPGTVIFLDIEEGGRMLPEQKAYIYGWVDAVVSAGYRAGVYCSGIPAPEGKLAIVTAEDIRENAHGRKITYWITNDMCPPSPGCAFPHEPPKPTAGGVAFASVWQFAQSPRRKDFSRGCPANYHRDGNCYPPGVDPNQHLHLDVDTANTPDPSHGK
ncbi:MAG: DUF1906 domain-containing protein [Acidobacteria bacterium]|nr:DUF1906 domain-containing protein [Acidobacteriota bacterium]